MAYESKIKEGNEQLLTLHNEIRAKIDEYDGKEMPKDVAAQIDGLEEKAADLRKMVTRMVNSDEREKYVNAVDTEKRLVIEREGEQKEYEIPAETKLWNAAFNGGSLQDKLAYFKERRLAEIHRSGDNRSPELKAFHYYLFGDNRTENVKHLTPYRGRDRELGGQLNPEVKAAYNEGTASQGGYLTPDIFAQELILPLANESWVRTAPRVRTINITSDSFKLPRGIYQSAAVLTTETTSYDEQEGTLAEQTFTPYKFTREVKASEEVLEDSRFDLWGELIQPDVVQAFAEAENTYMTTGTGSSQPEGVTVNAPAGVTPTNGTGNVTAISTADHVVNTYYSLDFKYRNNASWMLHDNTMKLLRGLKDGQNRYLLADNVNNLMGKPEMTILGRPVVINSGMPVPAANAKTIIFGDFRYFVITDRVGLTVKFAQELRAATGQVSWFVRKRWDSHMMLTAAFTRFTQSAT